MSQSKAQDYWLVRDSKNLIWGPVPREEILKLVRDGKLKKKTEIARSLSYWFSLEESDELLKFFPELSQQVEDKPEEPQIEPTQLTSGTGVSKTVPGEWLSDEYAEEFGYIVEQNSDGTTVARKKEQTETGTTFDPSFQDDEPTFVPAMEAETDPTLAGPEIIELQKRIKRRRTFIIIGTILIAAILGSFVIEAVLTRKTVGDNPIQINVGSEGSNLSETVSKVKVALILSDLSKLNEEISELQSIVNQSEGLVEEGTIVPLARAIMKREFLYDISGAVSILERLVAMPNLSDVRRAEVHNLLGIYLLETDPEKALVNFSKALETLKDDTLVKYNFALSLVAGDREVDAIKALNLINEEILDRDPLKPYVLTTLGRVTKGNPSIKHLKNAISLNGELDEARVLLGLRYLEKGKPDEAKVHFVQFIDYLPGFLAQNRVRNFRQGQLPPVYADARKLVRKAMTKRTPSAILLSVDGVLSTLLGELRDAEQAFKRALGMLPGNIDALKGMAFMRLKDGKEYEIENIIRAKTEENPTNFALNALLGISFLRQGKPADAAKNFKRLSSHHAKISSSWSWLAQSAMDLGNKEKGLEFYSRALSVNSRDLTALKALSKVGAGDRVSTDNLIKLLPF